MFALGKQPTRGATCTTYGRGGCPWRVSTTEVFHEQILFPGHHARAGGLPGDRRGAEREPAGRGDLQRRADRFRRNPGRRPGGGAELRYRGRLGGAHAPQASPGGCRGPGSPSNPAARRGPRHQWWGHDRRQAGRGCGVASAGRNRPVDRGLAGTVPWGFRYLREGVPQFAVHVRPVGRAGSGPHVELGSCRVRDRLGGLPLHVLDPGRHRPGCLPPHGPVPEQGRAGPWGLALLGRTGGSAPPRQRSEPGRLPVQGPHGAGVRVLGNKTCSDLR